METYRPQFHFTPQKNWMNDPNGLVYFDGEYHLFYQYNPFGDKWGHMSWGQAVSTDMLYWQHLPVALPEEDGVMIFSGSAVIDENNTSGFGQDGKPAMVAIYTGYRPADKMQAQNIAFSTDRGRSWTKYSGNPVIDIKSTEFRDPKVFWYEPGKRWIMVVALSADHKLHFYSSPDLKQWTLLSDFGPAGATGGVWECPDLFELPVDGNPANTNMTIVSRLPAGGAKDRAFKVAEDMLQAHPDMAGIFAINDPSALGAVAAIEKAGKAGAIRVVSIDGLPEGRLAIKNGQVYADAIQHPDMIGEKAVAAVVSYMYGEEVAPVILIPIDLYRQDDAMKDATLPQ